jgi:hypothetical protein
VREDRTNVKEGVMLRSLANYFTDEDGAVTVDWVVITAGVVAAAVAIFSNVESGGTELASDTETFMNNMDPN